jgi:hypothetical protein
MKKVQTTPYEYQKTQGGDGKHVDGMPKTLEKLNAKRHADFSAWIQAIRNAAILQLDPSDEWKEDADIIQVITIGKNDLDYEAHVPEPRPERRYGHQYDEYLYVIKLPMAIPIEQEDLKSNIIFIRPDDISLFECCQTAQWCTLVGNRGISKSWFQWKYILLCYRQDLFHLLKSLKPEKVTFNARQQRLETNEDVMFLLIQRNPVLPKLIVQTVAGKKSLFFYLNQSNDVFYAEHSSGALKFCTDEDSLILWEPGKENTPVEYHLCVSQIIATVSPHEKQFPEFQSEAITLYMPCPSELQIRLMGQILREFGKYPNDEEVHRRVRKYGPFITSSLFWSEFELNEFRNERDMEIERIHSSGKTLLDGIGSSTYASESPFFSHMIRFVVLRNSSNRCGGYARRECEATGEKVEDILRGEISKLNLEGLRMRLNNNFP